MSAQGQDEFDRLLQRNRLAQPAPHPACGDVVDLRPIIETMITLSPDPREVERVYQEWMAGHETSQVRFERRQDERRASDRRKGRRA